MDDRETVVPVEDPPDPALPDLQQRDLPLPAVCVDVNGAVRTHALPSRTSIGHTVPLLSTVEGALSAEPKRARALLIGTVAWSYQSKQSGTQVPWPANVPCEILHAGEVWVRKASGASDGVLGVIAELWAD